MGFMVGRKYEAGGIAKDGAKMVMAVANAQASCSAWAFLRVCVFVCLSICLPTRLSVSLSVSLSVIVCLQYDTEVDSYLHVTSLLHVWCPLDMGKPGVLLGLFFNQRQKV